jgi:hypothetical protein
VSASSANVLTGTAGNGIFRDNPEISLNRVHFMLTIVQQKEVVQIVKIIKSRLCLCALIHKINPSCVINELIVEVEIWQDFAFSFDFRLKKG